MKAILAKRDPPSKTRCCPPGRVLRGRETWQEGWLQRESKKWWCGEGWGEKAGCRE